MMRSALQILGVLAILGGLFWAGQGAGLIRWPSHSFMIDSRTWVWSGLAVAFTGAIVVWLSRR